VGDGDLKMLVGLRMNVNAPLNGFRFDSILDQTFCSAPPGGKTSERIRHQKAEGLSNVT
jgi:hypothetical protein